MKPGGGLDVTATVLTLDHDGVSASGTTINRQLGYTEFDLLVAKTLDTGVHASIGYGIDNQDRQVGFFQLTVYF